MSRPTVARVLAQGKINLFLRVLARESSGYHQLETLFCRLELADQVVVRVGVAADDFACSGPQLSAAGLGPREENLAWRAAAAYRAATGWPAHVAITIEKHIPVAGGLGGGSADAGAVLRALDALAPEPLGTRRLLPIAGALGTDVPFLTQDDSPFALAWGRGERMMMLPPLPSRPVLLVGFPFGVSSRDAYAWLAEARADAPPATSHAFTAEELHSWQGVQRLVHNDLEEVVAPRHAPIADVLGALRGLAESDNDVPRPLTLLAGSGSSVFQIGVEGGETVDRWPRALRGVADAIAGTQRTATALSVEPVRIMD